MNWKCKGDFTGTTMVSVVNFSVPVIKELTTGERCLFLKCTGCDRWSGAFYVSNEDTLYCVHCGKQLNGYSK